MFKVTVRSLDGILFDGLTSAVTMETSTGIIEVKNLHEPLIGVIATGEIQIKNEAETKEIITSKGVFFMREDNTLSIVCDTIIPSEILNLEEIREAKQKAEEYLASQVEVDTEEYIRVQAVLEIELAKLKAVERRNRPKF